MKFAPIYAAKETRGRRELKSQLWHRITHCPFALFSSCFFPGSTCLGRTKNPRTRHVSGFMAPKHQRKAGPSGTSSAKTSEKEGLLGARALKRAERFEARRIEAEEHKEAVRPHVPFMPPTPSDVSWPFDKRNSWTCCREMCTSVRVITSRPSRSTVPPSKSTVPALHTCQIWLRHG
jgi:hypothetical protein